MPTLSEPWLRFTTGRWQGPVTVPVLLRGDGPPLLDSWEIVQWADQRGEGPRLVPDEAADTVRGWVEIADRALEAGRVLTSLRVLEDEAALRESLPPSLRRLGPVGLAIGRDAVRRLLAKYGERDRSVNAWRDQLVDALQTLDDGLACHTSLIGAPSYADIAGAGALSFVAPHPSLRLGPHSARCWSEPAVAERFARLVAWRDSVMASLGHAAG